MGSSGTTERSSSRSWTHPIVCWSWATFTHTLSNESSGMVISCATTSASWRESMVNPMSVSTGWLWRGCSCWSMSTSEVSRKLSFTS